MSECTGKDCPHPSHNNDPKIEEAAAQVGLEPEILQEAAEACGAEPQAIRNPIITPGDPERFPLLEMSSQSCDIPISSEDEEAIVLMDALLETLDEEAAGLAAVQIGYPRRIFLLRNAINEEGEAENSAYINPVIVNKSKEIKTGLEGCLSLPQMNVRVERPKWITLKYMDLDGEFHTETFMGFWARAVMHEIDHLNGILISRYLEEEITKQPRRTRCGMKITPHRKKVIAARRAKKRRAKAQRKHTKSSGR